jgi:hypothetical protein
VFYDVCDYLFIKGVVLTPRFPSTVMKIPRWLILVLAGLSSGCALFRSPYGAETSEDIRELARRTNEVVADGDAGRLSLAESRQFLKQSQAQVQVMRIRGVGDEARPSLDALDREYAALLQQRRPLRRHTTSELRGTLFALQSLKPAPPVWFRPATTSTSDDTPTDTSTSDTNSRKDCDKDHDHHGHDRGDRDCDSHHDHR